jgi:hypothetical protein
VIPVFKALLALRVTQEAREFRVKLAHMEILVKKVTLVLLENEERKVILVKKVLQGSKVRRVLLELLGKMA